MGRRGCHLGEPHDVNQGFSDTNGSQQHGKMANKLVPLMGKQAEMVALVHETATTEINGIGYFNKTGDLRIGRRGEIGFFDPRKSERLAHPVLPFSGTVK